MYRPARKCPAFVKRCIQRRRREGEHPKQQWGLKSRRRQGFLPSRASVCLCVNSHTPQPAVGHARNPSAKYYHYIHILGLPRRDSPSRNRGPSWPLLWTCPTLLCFFTGKSEVWRAHCEACNLLGSQSSAPRLDSPHDRAHMFERCWRTWSGPCGYCHICVSPGVLVMVH